MVQLITVSSSCSTLCQFNFNSIQFWQRSLPLHLQTHPPIWVRSKSITFTKITSVFFLEMARTECSTSTFCSSCCCCDQPNWKSLQVVTGLGKAGTSKRTCGRRPQRRRGNDVLKISGLVESPLWLQDIWSSKSFIQNQSQHIIKVDQAAFSKFFSIRRYDFDVGNFFVQLFSRNLCLHFTLTG